MDTSAAVKKLKILNIFGIKAAENNCEEVFDNYFRTDTEFKEWIEHALAIPREYACIDYRPVHKHSDECPRTYDDQVFRREYGAIAIHRMAKDLLHQAATLSRFRDEEAVLAGCSTHGLHHEEFTKIVYLSPDGGDIRPEYLSPTQRRAVEQGFYMQVAKLAIAIILICVEKEALAEQFFLQPV